MKRSQVPCKSIIVLVENQYLGVLWIGLIEMCGLCWEAHAAGYMTRTEVWQCVYYLDIIRNNRDELRRIPKREPDDPYFRLQYGEGLLASILSLDDYKDWYYLKYLPNWRRRVYRLTASGKGADAPEERAARGVEDETKWAAKTTLNDFMEK